MSRERTADPLALRQVRTTPPPDSAELAHLLELGREAVVLFDLGGAPALVNGVAERLLASRMRGPGGTDAWRLFAEHADAVRRLAAGCGPGPVLEGRRLHVDEHKIVLELDLLRLPQGRFAVCGVDVTARIKGDRLLEDLQRRVQRFEDEQRRSAGVDPDTGALREAHFRDLAEGELERHLRYHRACAALAVEIDLPEDLTPTDHRVLLHAGAHQVRDRLRALDYLTLADRDATLLVLLPETTLEGATMVAERLLQALNRRRIRLPGGEVVPLTATAGVTAFERGDVLVDHLLDRALAALDDALRQGGGGLAVATGQPA